MIEQTSQMKRQYDGQDLKQMAEAALNWLEQHQETINALNVFPVPDGDTGTNMVLTMQSACREIAGTREKSVGEIAEKISYGAMMGSRGNSGVILSQIWRGFAHVMDERETFDLPVFVGGLRQASDTAYKGVVKPVEGTILTVSRIIAEIAEQSLEQTDDLTAMLDRIVRHAYEAVARTPEQLPVLKEAGVVDSGAQGLAIIFEGMLRFLRGETIVPADEEVMPATIQEFHTAHLHEQSAYNYDVQFVLKGSGLDVAEIRGDMTEMGDSTLVVGDESAVKVHIHVDDPGVPISYAVTIGSIGDVVIEYMQEQYEDFMAKKESAETAVTSPPIASAIPEDADIGIVTVAPGDGIADVFRSMGVSHVVTGGPTMNPSTEELLSAVQGLSMPNVILLPNDKNIILAASQVIELAQEKVVRVVPTVSIPQGVGAMLAFNPNGLIDDVEQAMKAAKDMVLTGEITTATRSVQLDGVQVEEGQIIGLIDGTLRVAGTTVDGVVCDLLALIEIADYDIITLYYGEGVRSEQAETLAESLRQEYVEQEIECISGGQPHYFYILSVE